MSLQGSDLEERGLNNGLEVGAHWWSGTWMDGPCLDPFLLDFTYL